MGITSKNNNLTKAKVAKNDEFYTQYSDIEAELSHYEVKHFADRVVYLPCDDWHFSQFVKYFEDNFTRLQLKALVATGINFDGAGYYYKKTSEGVITGELHGNGDFRSDACRQLMREADIIVTNPPFSLFREFVAQIMEFRKKFLIIGNQNAINYREFFPLLKNNKVWLGYEPCKAKSFMIPDNMFDGSNKNQTRTEKGCFQTLGNTCWFTNIEHSKHHEPMTLTSLYTPEKYPKYDNYDAIEVGSLKEIPYDYFEAMGVPITFLSSYCPDQFEILYSTQTDCHPDEVVLRKYGDYIGHNADGSLNGRKGNTCGNNPMLLKNDGAHAYYEKNGRCVQSCYSRLVIKRKTLHVEPEFLQSFVDGVERGSC